MKIERRQALKFFIASVAGTALSTSAFSSAVNERNNVFALPGDSSPKDEPVVINAGVGGNNSVDLLGRIDKDCLSEQPQLTILMVGTNDMNSVKHVPLPQYRENLSQLLSKLKRSGSKVLLMTILPAYEPYLLSRHPAAFYQPEGVALRRKQVNDVIKEVAHAQKVELLDIGMRFEAIGDIGLDKDSLIQNEANSNKTDGIHPTANGYRFIGLSVYDYILAKRLPVGKVVCFGDSITHGDGSVDKESYPAYLLKLLKGTS